jgi:hypothetical protein
MGEAGKRTGEGAFLSLLAPLWSPNQSSFDDRTEFDKLGSSGNFANSPPPPVPEAPPAATIAAAKLDGAVVDPVKLADRVGRAMADRGEGEVGTADRGDFDPPEGLLGPKEVCRNLGTSFPKSFEDLRDFVEDAVTAATPAAKGGDDDNTAAPLLLLLMVSSLVVSEEWEWDDGVMLLRRSGLDVGGEEVAVNERSSADFWGGCGGEDVMERSEKAVSIASGMAGVLVLVLL